MIKFLFILNISIRMHVLHAFFLKKNLTNYLFFIIKIVFNFKCIHVFASIICQCILFMNEKRVVGGDQHGNSTWGDHSSILPAGFGALLGCRGITISHNFPALREILVNLELLREATQVSPYLNSNLGPHTQCILCMT